MTKTYSTYEGISLLTRSESPSLMQIAYISGSQMFLDHGTPSRDFFEPSP